MLLTVGGTVPWLRKVSVFSVRSGDGPQDLPVNKSARAAGVTASATDPAYRLDVVYADQSLSLTRADLLDLVGAPRGSAVTVSSLQERGAFRVTHLPAQFADDDLTLLALGLGGEALSIDHGYPARLIAPNRPGVLQTKWVCRLEVQT